MPSKMQKLSLLTKIDLKFKIFLTFCKAKCSKTFLNAFFTKKTYFPSTFCFIKWELLFYLAKNIKQPLLFIKFKFLLTFCFPSVGIHFACKMHLELQNRQKQILVFRFLKKINSLESAQNIFLHLYFTEKIYDPYFSIDSSCSSRRIFSISSWCSCSFCLSWWLDTKQRHCLFWA